VRSHRLQGTHNMALLVKTRHRVHRRQVTPFLDGIAFLTMRILGRSTQATRAFSTVPCPSSTCNVTTRVAPALLTIAILQ
jgi:hypothetical protein